MIQLNLLPDVKVDFIKTQRTKRIVLMSALVIAAVSVLILIITFSYSAAQKKHLSGLNEDISAIRTRLESNSELTKMLSVQNQLNSLPTLYNGRPAADRLPVFLEQTTPANISLSKLNIDFSTSTLEVSGNTSSLSAVNAYVDTLKYTKFKLDKSSEATSSAFNEVVMSKFGTDKAKSTAGFTINFKFDPQIFDNSKDISLVVPSTVSTYAQQPNESAIFNNSQNTGGQ